MLVVDKQATAEKIRESCELAGITTYELSCYIGASYGTMKGYLSGKMLPSVTSLTRMCEVLNVYPDDLVVTKDDPDAYELMYRPARRQTVKPRKSSIEFSRELARMKRCQN